MRRLAGLLTFAALALPSSAFAAPPGHGLIPEQFTCDGLAITVIHSSGLSAYIGDQHYVAASFSFTPVGGGETETKTFGNKSGLGGAVTCSEEFPEGLFEVVAVPVPPAD